MQTLEDKTLSDRAVNLSTDDQIIIAWIMLMKNNRIKVSEELFNMLTDEGTKVCEELIALKTPNKID